MGRCTDLKHGVMLVDARLLTIFANIVVGAHGAHVAHTPDRHSVTTIAGDINELGVSLILLSLEDIIPEHRFELSGAVLPDFISHDVHNLHDFL